ncbi:hypothetical protein RHSIM_RhsimUnG0083200 [Rhododendron simsii]|uniref:Uncharacterized protein n=1 Tax=Rhododendron simsii TaxID=118357 RepID=A0A834FY01_RHOSS|nr:hypothetical protein RHSIM_RhsimUnG0083200 [Rhododendron simsii]
MVDSSINSPNIDPETYPTLLEMMQSLGKEYRSIDERSSNFRRPTRLSAIPGIHIPLQMDDSACEGVSSGQWDSDQEDHAERAAARAQASTSTSSGGPPNKSRAGGENAPRETLISSSRYLPHLKPCRIAISMAIVQEASLKNSGRRRVRLAESNNLSFSLGDLMLMYMVSRNLKYDKYCLTTRQHFDHLVDRLCDTEKWGNILVKVFVNFEWGPINPLLDYPFPTRTGAVVEKQNRIHRVRGFLGAGDKPDCSAPNKGLFITDRWPYLIALIRAKKKARVAENVEVLTSGLIEDDPTNLNESSALFVPDFECSDGHIITIGDSLEENPLLAINLLKGLALLKDMEKPIDRAGQKHGRTMPLLCQGMHFDKLSKFKQFFHSDVNHFSLQAGQCASKAFGDMDVLLETKGSLKGDLQAKRMEAEQLADQIKALEVTVVEAKIVRQERDLSLLRIKDAEAENDCLKEEKKQIEEDLSKKLKEAGDSSYNEAGECYQQQMQILVTKAFKEGELKGIRDTYNSSFLRGYQVNLDYSEVDHRREPPVVPPMELPESLLPAE